MRTRLASFVVCVALMSAYSAGAQDGCYFGVCPGDPGTEFPTTPTVKLPTTFPPPQQSPTPSESETEGKGKSGKTKSPLPPTISSAVQQLCSSAFVVNGEFDWDPAMTARNAIAVCDAALRENPSNRDLQFYYAVARDVWGEWGDGSPADDFYAVTAYRELAESGYAMAEYALGTMYDEDAGVSKADGIALAIRSVNGEFGASAACSTYLSLAEKDDLQAAGLELAAEPIESLALTSPTCSSALLNIITYAKAGEFSTSLTLEHYARVAAMRGTGWGMYYLGAFYAIGGENLGAPYAGRVTLPRDVDRGGQWLLLHYWWSMQRLDRSSKESEWFPTFFQGDTAIALQTALALLGHYSGPIDGDFGPKSKAALDAFMATNSANALFQRLRSEEPNHPTLPMVGPVALGDAALDIAIDQPSL